MARLLLLASLVGSACATVFFEEKFESGWDKKWVKSSWKQSEGTAGEFTWTAGKWYGDAEADKGIQTGPDARFYAISAPFPKISTEGKELVVQFSAKHEQKLDCGGGYIKLLPSTSNMKTFGGDTDYSIMFGPDICGYSTKRVHVIFTKDGKNHLTKKDIACETDELTHVYTLIVKTDNSYEVLIDNESKHNGTLYEDYDILPPKTIKDPEAKKPEDWDERERIPDVNDVKPEGYDDIPEKIADKDAKKPEDWDDEDDGEWEPPLIANPEYKGPWVQKTIANPDYKGIWEAPDIPNPEFKDNPTLYAFSDLANVGFELWQVKAGTIFDNILVTDDRKYAKEFAEKTWGASKEAEKKMFDEVKEEERKKEEEERKKREAEEAASKEEEEEEEFEEEEETAEVKDEL